MASKQLSSSAAIRIDLAQRLFADLPGIVPLLAQLPPHEADCLEFLILTVARPAEVLHLQLASVEFGDDGGAWRPQPLFNSQHASAKRAQNKRPMSPAAQAVVRRAVARSAAAGPATLVFAGPDGGAMTSDALQEALQTLDARLHLTTWRECFRTWCRLHQQPGHASEVALGLGGLVPEGSNEELEELACSRQLVADWAGVCLRAG